MASKHNTIPLFPNILNSSSRPLAQHDDSDDIQSDFPPCRIHETTPEPATPPNLRKSSRLRRKRRSSPSESEASEQSPRQLPHSQLPTTGLRAKNILNTIQAKVKFPILGWW
jgi:hypothetical protein